LRPRVVLLHTEERADKNSGISSAGMSIHRA
jgi:hypothetical protein